MEIISRSILSAAVFIGGFLCLSPTALSAPYPKEGKTIDWVQPDGTFLSLRVFGDEFYGRTETKEGFTVVFNEADKTYYYAKPGLDGAALVSTGTAAHRPVPVGLEKKLDRSEEAVRAIRDENIRKFVPDRAEQWAARVNAVRELREMRAKGVVPKDDDPLAAPVSGTKVGLVILVQFPDDPATPAVDPVNFPTTQAKIERYCNNVGYVEDGNTGSIRDYFHDQSNGALNFTQTVSTVVTMPQPRAYYNYSNYPTNTILGDSGVMGRRLVNDAVARLVASGFDFSSLTVDGSNYVVSTSLFFAGSDSGVWAKGLWPHAYSVSPAINVGGRFIYRYQCTSMPSAAPVIGTNCHELGHLLMGYPDFYDTDASDGDSEGVGEHSLMGSGNHLNSGRTPAPIDLYLKDYSGWANITDVSAGVFLDGSLPSTGNVGYRVRKPGSTTEYFLFENRGSGDRWATHSPDKGIAIWHVDEAVTTDNRRQQMTPTQHYELSLEQADGLFDLENNRDRGDPADLFDSGSQIFNDTNIPNANWWNGASSGISFSVLSAPGAIMNVRFGATVPTDGLTLSPPGQSVTASGGTFGFDVATIGSWTWTDDATWVNSSEASPQSGNQTFTYTVAANATSSTRTATITVTNGTAVRAFTITQAGAISDDHGNSIATATLINASSTTAGNIETAGDNDYFRINLATSGTLTIGTTGITDTYGYLLDSGGTTITYNDDSTDTNFRIIRSLSAGTYYIRVRHFYSSSTGQYQLVSSFTGGTSADDHGDAIATATTVDMNSSTPGVIGVKGDVDFFRVDIPVPGTLTLQTTGSTDTYGDLLSSIGAPVADNDNQGAGLLNFKIVANLPAGVYHVKVRHASADGVGSYNLLSSFVPAPAPEIAIEGPGGADYESGFALADFGLVPPGTNASVTFTIKNTGDGTLNGVFMGFDGIAMSDYSGTAPPPPTLGPGETSTFTIRLTPTVWGNRPALLIINSNDPDESAFEINLNGGATPRTLFDSAAISAGLNGLEVNPLASPKHDGVPNLLKYAFNMNLGAADQRKLVPGSGTAGLPAVTLEGTGGTRTLKVEFVRRKGSGLNYQAKKSISLANGSFINMTGTPIVTSINADWERVVVRDFVNMTTVPKNFAVVEVEVP